MPAVTAPVTVGIVHRNRAEQIGLTVEAFRSPTAPTKIIVVDNGSDASTVDALADLVGDAGLILDGENLDFGAGLLHRIRRVRVGLILDGENLGFGPGVNIGMRRFLREGIGEWVALALRDAMPRPDTIEKMLAAVPPPPQINATEHPHRRTRAA